jgi:hypothetical protein
MKKGSHGHIHGTETEQEAIFTKHARKRAGLMKKNDET